jgi:hypothetical protein
MYICRQMLAICRQISVICGEMSRPEVSKGRFGGRELLLSGLRCKKELQNVQSFRTNNRRKNPQT